MVTPTLNIIIVKFVTLPDYVLFLELIEPVILPDYVLFLELMEPGI